MKKFSKIASIAFVLLLFVSVSITAFATAEDTPNSDGLLVNDMADVLTYEEELELGDRLYNICEKYGMSFAIVTTDNTGDKTPEEYADDYYDYNDYYEDGGVLLLSTDYNERHFSTSGEAIDAFNDKAFEYIFVDNVAEYFDDGDWYEGFSVYVELTEECVDAYCEGEKYPPVSAFDIWKDRIIFFGISLAIGIVIAVLIMRSVKSKYKNVRFNSGAENYVVKDSFKLNQSYDTFLYSTVTRTAKPKDNDSSSTHTSSSGNTHGGGSF